MTILEFLAQGSIDGKIMKSRFSRTFDEDFRETGESLLVTEKKQFKRQEFNETYTTLK